MTLIIFFRLSASCIVFFCGIFLRFIHVIISNFYIHQILGGISLRHTGFCFDISISSSLRFLYFTVSLFFFFSSPSLFSSRCGGVTTLVPPLTAPMLKSQLTTFSNLFYWTIFRSDRLDQYTEPQTKVELNTLHKSN